MTSYSNYKDFYLRKSLKNNQKNIFLYKFFLLNQKNCKKNRFKIMLKLMWKYNELLGSKFKNRCMFSTKVRSVFRIANLTKSSLRENLRAGNLSGFKKASW